MASFHSGMNFWQKKWLSDRLHKKDQENQKVPSFRPAISPKTETPVAAISVPQKKKVSPYRPTKITWPSAQDLEKLVWSKPMIQVGKELGVSDKAIGKRCKKLGIKTPPQGYWLKSKPET